MNTSLRDQLLKVGLVTEKQAKQAAQQEQQRQYRVRPPKRAPQAPPPARQSTGQSSAPAPKQPSGNGVVPGQQAPVIKQSMAAQQAQAAKVARDLELNRRREEKAQRRARIAQIEQLVEQSRLPRLDSDDHYSFIDGKKIRRMSVDAQRREQLTSGELLIVRYKGHYAVVPKAAAERIRERDETMVVPHLQAQTSNTPSQTTEASAEDPYKDFVVPDDLMW